MLRIVRTVLKLAGEYAGKIKIAFVFSILESIFAQLPIMTVLYILIKIVSKSVTIKDAWVAGIVVFVSIIFRTLAKWSVDMLQSGTGYKIFARERMKIGDRLKRFPMGYFTEGNIGNITAVITSDFEFVEQWSMETLSKITSGYLSVTLGTIMITILDYRIGIISIITIILAILALKKIQNVGEYHSAIRQEAQSRLVNVVIEYVKGISVIKSLNMVGDKSKIITKEFHKFRDTCLEFEEKFVPPNFLYESCFSIGIGFTILASSYFAFNQTINISFMLMMLIFIFQIYIPFKALGGLTADIRVMEAALNRYDDIKDIKIIDENGKDIKLNNFNIEFKDVSFAYEDKNVLKNINFEIPEHSMTALVGASGCGKTTIANLVARFWDVQKGEVLVGGINVKEMTCDSLLKNISMVFQEVYLFNDTILNNIKIGKPDATEKEVIEAAKKARCHDFITELKNGYDTMIGEGGSTLSGGEKQRISIARAILKDAPIILLDEATASVDPDNEKYIQMAINELVKDKTLVVIAHRLSTVKNADQILVIDKGEIIQRGNHNELIEQKGQYNDFWKRRMNARSWKIIRLRSNA
ncbi:ABC transporter ATP-binding protein [Clostridium sp. 'deep sea']|uniref:ABC transporter ATP-binding protein n=1 Tax=Clostridium sp. 'deep sea' TaxID=2779445 RepID=UPI00189684DD|nr:ABC transporter ATP-binding protein [Clostridium sp. 'deep sea']QOR34646.1 ABC transporter ATP-binding protein [Clostridium sp. 'deep sea']